MDVGSKDRIVIWMVWCWKSSMSGSVRELTRAEGTDDR